MAAGQNAQTSAALGRATVEPMIGLAPDAPDHLNSGFLAALRHIRLPPDGRILEVGGLSGAHTTVHLLEVFANPIDIVEIDERRVGALVKKYASDRATALRVTLHHADAREFETLHRYDLLVIDLQTGAIDRAFEEVLPEDFSRWLKEDGLAIVYTIYDLAAAYEVPDPPGDQEEMRRFMQRFFESETLSLGMVDARMRPEGFAAVGLVDRWMLNGYRKGHAWVILRKIGAAERI